jgi:hypothetical protein
MSVILDDFDEFIRLTEKMNKRFPFDDEGNIVEVQVTLKNGDVLRYTPLNKSVTWRGIEGDLSVRERNIGGEKMIEKEEFRKRGGEHLRVVREWIQDNFLNGDTCIWGSDEVLRSNRVLTPGILEELAVDIAFAAVKEAREKEKHEEKMQRALGLHRKESLMSDNKPYIQGFDSEEDIFSQFKIDEHDRQGIKILLANYDTPDYSGYAFILFEHNGELYEVNASHCSCYGLEGQWEPEKVSVSELTHRVLKGNLGKGWYGRSQFSQELLDILRSAPRS